MRSPVRISTNVLVWAALAVGCGDLYSDPADAPGSTQVNGGVVDEPTEVGPPSMTAPVGPNGSVQDQSASCPVDILEGSTCFTTGATCEIGASQDLKCNTTLECIPNGSGDGSGQWTSRPSTLCPSYACPSNADAIATIDGMPCTIPQADGGPAPADADELVCRMNDGTCACTTGTDAAHHHARVWACVKPTAGCTVQRPLSGSACTSAQDCDYGSCAFKHGLEMTCDGIAWRTKAASCK